jgi:glycosyltransferase involved in cell wall biosynthesis
MEGPLKLAYEASSIRPGQSGVGHYTAALLQSLRSEFPDISLLLLSHRARDERFIGGLTVTQKHSFPIKEIWMQLWVPRILARHSPDLCHFTNGIAPLSIKVPYVVTLHDLSLIRHPEWHPKTRRLWMRRILRPSLVRAAGVICDSEKTRSDLLAWLPIDDSKVAVVPLAARALFFRICADEEKRRVRERYGLRRPFVLYVGNIEPRKNLPRVLEAFGSLDMQDSEFVIAGRPAWMCRNILRAAARNPRRVRVLNYVPEEDLPAVYQSAVAFVYPSLMEGFGLPVLEAMASGTPVLVSDIEPLSSLVGSAGWLVAPEDTCGWRNALSEAFRDAGKRKSLKAEGRKRAIEYGWQRTARETMSFYQHALGHARRTRRCAPDDSSAVQAGRIDASLPG